MGQDILGTLDFVVPEAKKYPRTFHLPYSLGTTSDDRIAKDITSVVSGDRVIITEKLDGENTCLNERGVFSRSHGAHTRNPWASYLWDLHSRLKGDMRTLELFGESLYAVHSIKYSGLPSYFFLFAVRDGDQWLSWDEVVEYASILSIPTVPVLYEGVVSRDALKPLVESYMRMPSRLSAEDLPSPTEGVVIRLAHQFPDAEFSTSVYKMVRKGHVQTSEHWTKHWQRAFLGFELEGMGRDGAMEWLETPPA